MIIVVAVAIRMRYWNVYRCCAYEYYTYLWHSQKLVFTSFGMYVAFVSSLFTYIDPKIDNFSLFFYFILIEMTISDNRARIIILIFTIYQKVHQNNSS